MLKIILAVFLLAFTGASAGLRNFKNIEIPRDLKSEYKEIENAYIIGSQTSGLSFRIIINENIAQKLRVIYINSISVSSPLNMKTVKIQVITDNQTNNIEYNVAHSESKALNASRVSLYNEVGIGSEAHVIEFFKQYLKKDSQISVTCIGKGIFTQKLTKKDVTKIYNWFIFYDKVQKVVI